MPETTLQPAVPTPLTTLTDDEILFRDNIRQFADDKIRPLVREMDEKGIFDKDLIREFFQLGLMGIEIPEQYGGGGAKFFEAILAVEELSRVDASAGVIVDVQNTLVNNALLEWGSAEQKKHYLPKMASETVGAYALSEAGSGSDAFALQTRAQLQGSDYVLNGRKLWITNSKEAGLFVLFATLDPTTRKLRLPTNQSVLLTDTVGFIRKLPHGLVEAFKATLEEVVQADLLVHVVDARQSADRPPQAGQAPEKR